MKEHRLATLACPRGCNVSLSGLVRDGDEALCLACHETFAISKQPLEVASKRAIKCTNDDCDGADLFCDVHSGHWVCLRCGREGGVALGGADTTESLIGARGTVNTYKRRIYFNERMSQWCFTEPVPPLEHLRALEAAYRRLVARGVLRAGVALNKSEVSLVIKEAGLLTRQLLEKWLSLRTRWHGPVRPRPPEWLVEGVRKDFRRVADVWKRRPELHPGRINIIRLDCLIPMLIMRRSQALYTYYAEEFPLPSPSCVRANQGRFLGVCIVLGWSMPVVFALSGRLGRVRLGFRAGFYPTDKDARAPQRPFDAQSESGRH